MRICRAISRRHVRRRFRAGDRLASYGRAASPLAADGGAYTYNAAGCVTRIERGGRPSLDLTWNSQYQLVSVSTNGVFAESYAYDALGRRVATTTLDGTVRHVYDDRTYDAWGNVLSEEVSVPALVSVRYRFQGREWSAVTGLTNFRMRWYDAETGRWLSKDPIGLSGGLNLYAFCENDSANGQDALGTDRYITQFWKGGIHVGVAVDTWEKRNGKWRKTGTRTFNYGATGDIISLNTVRSLFMNGEAEIKESNGNTLRSPRRISSCPEQDIEMIDKIRSEMGWPSFYNLFNRKVFGGIFCLGDNCITWSERVIKYGM